MSKVFKAYAPASAANISVGFDLLGAALKPIDGAVLGDEITISESDTDGCSVKTVGRFAHKLPTDQKKNIVYDAYVMYKEELEKRNLKPLNVHMELSKNLPVCSGLGSSAAADTFYIPKEFLKNDMFKKSMDVYLSPDKKSAQIIVVFNSNPSATEATDESQELSAMAKKSFQGTALKNATVAMGGQSSKIKDTKSVASGDFIRTAAIMLIGIGIALMFVTRSLLQPVYILGTLLIAYLCSLSINQWIVKAVLGRSMLTWNTPFFSFIMLIALGVDYSIFLMTRYNELKEEGFTTPSSRILKACAIIGTVVISAAIILGGTFAALIPSGIPTLIEVALTVDVGLLILVFILPITLSAAVKLTYEGIDFGKYFKRNKTNN